MANTLSIIIYGASGDLSHRKLVPALFRLFRKKRLPDNFHIFGTGGRSQSDEDLRQSLYETLKEVHSSGIDESAWKLFSQMVTYHEGDLTKPETYQKFEQELSELEKGPADRMYYLATPPEYFLEIINGLAAAGMLQENGGWRRVVIEKPFGSDQESARSLNHSIHAVLNENQVYRIDHYLAKETVQNVLIFRFANSIFEPLWNRNFVDHIQIMVAEQAGVGTRGGYYDQTGVVRDMIQNHLLQLLTLITMEPPVAYNAWSLRDEKVKVLQAVRNAKLMDCIQGQYRGYRDEPGVQPDSRTPTYAALKVYVDNWRWQGVPIYLRTGKKLAERSSEISLQFKRVPHFLFPENCDPSPNHISICIAPDEGVHLGFETKVPGASMRSAPADMVFHYGERFGEFVIPDAYERLLMDAIQGDASLFARRDEIEGAWMILDPLIAALESPAARPPAPYHAGSWGPDEACTLLEQEGYAWHYSCSRG